MNENDNTIFLIFVKTFCPNCDGTVSVVGATRDEIRANEIKKEFEKRYEIVYIDEIGIE